MEWYSSTSCTAIPIGAPPRHMATRNVGRNPLFTTSLASSIESRSRELAEMKSLSMGGKLTVTRALRELLTNPSVKAPSVKAPSVKAPGVKGPHVEAPSVKAQDVKIPIVKTDNGRSIELLRGWYRR